MYSTFSDFQSRIEEKVYDRSGTSPELPAGEEIKEENGESFTKKTEKQEKNSIFFEKGGCQNRDYVV